jgi:hypothetical protein
LFPNIKLRREERKCDVQYIEAAPHLRDRRAGRKNREKGEEKKLLNNRNSDK